MRNRLCLRWVTLLFSSLAFSLNAAPLKVGISLVDLSNPFFATLAKEISNGIQQRQGGGAQIYVRSSAYNLQKQTSQLEQFLQDKVDLIFVAASQSEAIAPVISRARAEGVIVVAVDIESAGADISVTSDNMQAGFSACDYLAVQLNRSGQVAIINGQPISSVINRVTGCKQALAQYKDLLLVSDTRNSSGTFSGGLESMTYLLLEYPQLDGVFTINDPAALGALEAAQQLDNQQVKIVSVDGSQQFVTQLAQPQSNLLATAGQFPVHMARRAVELALERLQDNSIAHKSEYIQTRLVTRHNLDAFQHWQEPQ